MIADQMLTQFETPSNPFPGLRPFEFDESLLYFGRDGQSEQLLRKLVTTRFMAVVGTSGSGKSSLVRAGLLPALFGGFMTSADSDWHIAIFRPSNDPMGNLARAINDSGLFGPPAEGNAELQATMIESTLRRGSLGLVEAVRLAQIGSNQHVLVVVDQFEELFRFAQVAEGERYQNDAAAFVKLLLEASHQREIPIYVVLTMRSDFLGDCSLFWDLPEAINDGQYLIPRLTREQRREAITGPAAVCGAALTPRLVNRLLNDMGDNPDQLPILQHALMRTWNRWKAESRDGEPIDLWHYEAIGEMRAALSLHADEAYNELRDDRSRAIAERVFKGLTEKGADNREIRRPMELKELCALTEAGEAEVIAVIEVFRREGRSFLMPPAGTHLDGNSLIDISHESLIRNWERLKAWVDEEARSARIYRRLAETSVLHQKSEAGLYRDPDLHLALDWRDRNKPNQTWARRYHPGFESSMTFLDQSREARDREARDREAQRRREIKRTRLTAIIFAFAFVLSLGALGFANIKRVEANESRQSLETALVEANEQRNRANEASIKFEEQATIANKNLKLAAEAESGLLIQARIASENARRATIAAAEALKEKKRAVGQEARAEEETKRSRELLYAANLNLAQEAYGDANTQRAQELLEEDSASLAEVRGFEWGYLRRLYDRAAGTLEPQGGNVGAVAFSSSDANKRILATAAGKTVKLMDTSSSPPRELFSIPEQSHTISAFALSPDGKRLATATDKTVRVWAVGSSQQPTVLPDLNEPVTALAFSPESDTLAVGTGDERTHKGGTRIWSLGRGTFSVPGTDPEFDYQVKSLVFSADGKKLLLASSRYGHEVKLGLYDTSRVGDPIRFELDDLTSFALSPDGKFLVAGTRFGTQFQVFDTTTKKEIATLDGFTPNTGSGPLIRVFQNAVVFSPDGSKLAAGSFDRLKLYDTAELKLSKPPTLLSSLLGTESFVSSISFSPDGNLLATNDSEKVRLWDTSALREYVTLAKPAGVVRNVIFSPDNKTASFTAHEGPRYITKLMDIATQREAALPDAQENKTLQSAFSSNGKFMSALDRDGADTVKVWDTETRNLVASVTQPPQTVNAGDSDFVAIMAVSPDGKTVATVDWIHRKPELTREIYLRLWDMDSKRGPIILKSNLLDLLSTSFSPDGKTLACAGVDTTGGVIQLWNVATQKVELLRTPNLRMPTSIVFSSDGKRFAVAGYNGVDTQDIELWDAISLKRIAVVAERLSGAGIYFSPDMKTLAITGQAYDTGISLTLLDLASNRKVQLRGHTKPITCVAFSPDGKTIATGSEDKLVKLWSASSHRLLATFDSGEGVVSIAFSPDGRMMITGGLSGSVKLWQAASPIAEGRKP